MSFRPDIYNAIKAEELPPLLRLSSYDRESQDDIIVYTWDKQSVTKKEKIEMRKNNDFSYRQKALFKKVGSYNAGYGKINYIYKAINAWGDGKWANEFYATPEKSVIDNGFIKVDELKTTDAQIMAYFGVTALGAPSAEQVTNIVDERIANELAAEDKMNEPLTFAQENANTLIELGAKKVSKGQLLIDGQHWYLDLDKWTILGKTDGRELYLYPEGKKQDGPEVYVGSTASRNGDNIISEFSISDQIKEFGQDQFNIYDKQIGDIITIENGKFRLLDVQETEFEYTKLLKLFSQSGLTSYATLTYNDNTNGLDIKIISPEELELYALEDNDWKEEDNNDTCNPF
jgi:hypothetical protein